MFTYNRVLAEDCTQLLRTLPDASIDLVLTDPPYFGYRDRTGRTIANDVGPSSVLQLVGHLVWYKGYSQRLVLAL